MPELGGKDLPDISITHSYAPVVGDRTRVHQQFVVLPPAERHWPVIVGRPPQPIGKFIERPGPLAEAISPGGDDQKQRLVLIGDGGVGKTELAAVQFRERVKLGADLGLWVTATSRQAVLSAYWQTARELGLESADAEEGTDRLLAWLAGTAQSWIVVLDDVADPVDLQDLWPQGRAGQVVVTTRRSAAAWQNIATPVEIDVFTPAESVSYLQMMLKAHARRLPGILSEAAELAADLGHLPLALSHASAVIADDGISCAEYRDLLHDRLQTLADVMPEDPAAIGSGYPTAVPAAWSLALDRADALKPQGLARPLWRVISCLEASAVPEAALFAEPTRRYLAAFALKRGNDDNDADNPVSNRSAKDALRNLHRLSLIRHLPDKAVRTHPLAQRATRESCAARDLVDAAHTAADALAETWPGDGAEATAIEIAVSNTDAVRAACPEAVWEPEAHVTLFHRGYLTGESGLAVGAAAYFAQLADESAVRLGADHPDTRLARRQHARWLGESGRFAEAAACYRRLVHGQGQDAADSGSQLEQRFWLAHYTGAAGDYVDAVRQYDALMLELEETAEIPPEFLLEARRDRARWIGADGETDRAIQLLEEVLKDTRRTLGADSARILAGRAAIAETRARAGDSGRALSGWEALVPDYIRTLGRAHRETLAARHNLAVLRAEVVGLPAAADEMGQLLSDALSVMGTEDPRLLNLRAELARAVGRARSPHEAISLLEGTVRELTSRGQGDDRRTFVLRANLAAWRGRAGLTSRSPSTSRSCMTSAVFSGSMTPTRS